MLARSPSSRSADLANGRVGTALDRMIATPAPDARAAAEKLAAIRLEYGDCDVIRGDHIDAVLRDLRGSG